MLAPAAVGAGVPIVFQRLVGIGDIVTAAIAIVALIMLRYRIVGAIAVVWLLLIFGLLDTIDAIIQSLRYHVFTEPLGVNWVIVTGFVPALLVSSVLILMQLLRREGHTVEAAATLVAAGSGSEGDVIRVVNRDSRRALRARVVAPGMGEILHD